MNLVKHVPLHVRVANPTLPMHGAAELCGSRDSAVLLMREWEHYSEPTKKGDTSRQCGNASSMQALEVQRAVFYSVAEMKRLLNGCDVTGSQPADAASKQENEKAALLEDVA